MTNSQIIEANKKIALLLEWYIRKPEKYSDPVGVEVYSKLHLAFARHAPSQNPIFPEFESENYRNGTTTLRRKMVIYIDVKNMEFHKSWDWFMLAWQKLHDTIEGTPELRGAVIRSIINPNLSEAYKNLILLIQEDENLER